MKCHAIALLFIIWCFTPRTTLEIGGISPPSFLTECHKQLLIWVVFFVVFNYVSVSFPVPFLPPCLLYLLELRIFQHVTFPAYSLMSTSTAAYLVRGTICWEMLLSSNRLRIVAKQDLFTVMIQGPMRTPYEDGLFFFDVQLPSNYPLSPPVFFYVSYCTDRLNPNLYEDGKVCISLLGTWTGKVCHMSWGAFFGGGFDWFFLFFFGVWK